MAHGRAPGHHRPRMDTAHWAAAATVGCVVLTIATSDRTYLFPAGMFFALLFQCAQSIVVDGRYVSRVGLRPVVIDLVSAEVIHEGSAWWRELFFCGPMLQLRDAEGRRLYLESWLWDANTCASIVEAVGRQPHP